MKRFLHTRRALALASLALFGILSTGCDSLLETEPIGVDVIENQLATPGGSLLFVNSIYQPLPGLYGGFNAAMQTILEATTDDGWPRGQGIGPLKSRDIDPSQGPLPGLWDAHFNGITRANIFLAREGAIDYAATDQEALRDQLVGEALFLRAFYYFNLVRLFGDVPLYTDEVLTIPEAQKPRTPAAEVYAQIKSDLTTAIPLLPDTHSGQGDGNEEGRVTSGAARTLLAKVHLTLEEWSDVIAVTNEITGYQLRNDFIENFYGLLLDSSGENEVEAIFEVQFSGAETGPKSFIRVSYTPPGTRDGQGQILPTDAFYTDALPGAFGPNAIAQAFEPGDVRFDVTLSRFERNQTLTSAYFLPDSLDENGLDTADPELLVYKFYSDINNTDTAWNVPIFRYAEVLLMRAEAFAELGQVADALALVDQIRERAGLPTLTDDEDPDDQASAIAAVRQERRVELAFEHKRFFDLNRWGLMAEALAPQGVEIPASKITQHPITGNDQVLWPIPSNEIERNPNASQNDGY